MEEKYENTVVLSLAEKILFEKMTDLLGRDLQRRFLKFTEEYRELLDAAGSILLDGVMPKDKANIIDELADVNAVLFHIAALLGYSQKKLLEMAYTKIIGRENNPNFMRKHPHEEVVKETAGEYQHFEQRFNEIM